MPVVAATGPEGLHLLGGSNPGLTLAGMGPEGPNAFVFCQKSSFLWGFVLGHRMFVPLPTIMRWGTVGSSMLGCRFDLNSLE